MLLEAKRFCSMPRGRPLTVFPAWKIRWKTRSEKSPKEEKSTRKKNNDVKNQMEREGSVFAINCEALEIDEDSASLNVIK